MKQNWIESPDTDPNKHKQLIVDKGARATQWSRVFLTLSDSAGTGPPGTQKKDSDTGLTAFTKTQLKMNHRPQHKMQNCKTPIR